MLRALTASFAFSLVLLLAACGGEADSSAIAPEPLPVSVAANGNVVKGLIRNGMVSAWRWQAGVYVKVASARTGSAGEFTLSIPDPVPGEVLRLQLDVLPDASARRRTEMLCDVARCGSALRGEWVPLGSGMGLRSWASVGADGNVTLMPMTPVSTLLVGHAESLGDGRLTEAGVEVARLRVAALFGLTPEQLLARPGNILDTLWLEVASEEAVRLSVLSAAVAELASLEGSDIGLVMDTLVERFNSYDGHLMQAGESGSLADLYQGALSLAAGNGAVFARVQDWLAAAVAGLRYGELNTSACGEACGNFDSNRVILALGEGSDTLGGDLRRLMTEQGTTRIEDLLAAQLSRYGWLVGSDTLGLAEVAWNVVALSALSSVGMNGVSIPGVTVVREGNILHLDGSFNNYAIDLDITVPPLLQQIYAYTPGSTLTFVIGAHGFVQKGRLRGRLDGTLTIVADGTDFTPARNAMLALYGAMAAQDQAAAVAAQGALLDAVGGIIRSGEATFALQGEAALARLEPQGDALVEASQLAIAGRGQMHLDMNGLPDGGILAEGRADYGSLTLPNGDRFHIDPEQGHALTFALGADGTATLAIGADVLGHDAAVSGSGRLLRLGVLLNHLRDNVATLAETLVLADTTDLDVQPTLAQLLTDLRGLELALTGQAVIPDYGHTYTLAVANGVLRISQPDSTETALELALLAKGLVARAGGQWWLVGLDLAVPGYPALTLADSDGGEWRWDFNFSGQLATTEPAISSCIDACL